MIIPLISTFILLGIAAMANAQPVRFQATDWPYGGGAFTSLVQASDGCVYAVSTALGLFRSCTEGRSWSTMRDVRGMPIDNPRDVYVDRETGRVLVLSDARPMQMLEVNGAAWRAVTIDSLDNPVQFVSSEGAIIVYAMSAGAIYRSDDVGESWRKVFVATSPLSTASRPLVVDGRRAQVLYLAIGTSIVRSTDGGTTWLRTIDSLWTASQPLLSVTRGGIVIAANESGDVFRSRDSG
ncbi:MAG: hypothetical protein H7X80_02920, partial [bacterium]|nr:hypothetical protein [Candidatus Kapabacteria bacterium]